MLISQQYGSNIFVLLVMLFRCGTGQDVCKKEISTKGRHFLVTVPPILLLNEFNCSIDIASSGYGHAIVLQHNGDNIHSSMKLANYSMLRGDVQNLYISGKTIDQSAVGKQTKVIEIVSSVDISVYVTAYGEYTAASLVVFPDAALSVEYSVPTYKTFFSVDYNYLLITSLYNDTHINVSNYHSNKLSVHETISRLESYTSKTLGDPRLVTVKGSKPVNVVVGSMCTFVPNWTSGGCDTLFDSQIPFTFWGKDFIVPPLKPKTGRSIRIYPRTQNTTVNIEYYNNTLRKYITFKDMKEILLETEPTVIRSDQPVNVVQYGFTEPDNGGGAFMTSVPAITHFSNDYVFTTPFPDKGFTYWLVITIASSHLNGLLLSGKNVSRLPFVGKWTPSSPFGNYTVFTLEIQPGVYILRHQLLNVKFAALLYGLKYAYGFGHSLGLSFSVENPHTCQNGGSCTSDGKCVCPSGFTGDSCEHNIDDCGTNSKCLNGATCIDGVRQFSCQCSPGLTGRYCEIAIPVQQSRHLTCFSCQYTSALSFCDSLEHCKVNQTCYHQLVTNAHGHKHYKSGCTDKQICNQYSLDGQDGDACLHCCEENFCNSHGCGDNGLPPRESRGPLCLDCENVRNPEECDQITFCSSDEICRIEELPWGENSLFHLGCKAINECATETMSLGKRTLARSVPVCVACCHDDFCNTNCTRQDHSQSQIVVG